MIYTIHMKTGYVHSGALPDQNDPTSEGRFDGLVAVPDGVAKWALFFPPFWLAFHALWLPLFIYGLLVIALLALLATPYWIIPALLGGLPGLYLFLEGNQLRRNKLDANDYTTIGVVDARDAETAIHRFLAEGELPKTSVLPASGIEQTRRQSFSSQSGNHSIGLFAQDNS